MNTPKHNMSIKYPRTFHHFLSMAVTADDKRHSDDKFLDGMNVVILEKRDGECTTMLNNHIHARSIDSKDHESRHVVKRMWSEIRHMIPDRMRVCGENMYAQHSIKYNDLESYFEVFNIWEDLKCLSWSDTCEYAELLGLKTVPVIYEGIYSLDVIKGLIKDMDIDRTEGFVIRNKDSFMYDEFKMNVVKIVREGHVQTDKHWMHKEIIKNKLISS